MLINRPHVRILGGRQKDTERAHRRFVIIKTHSDEQLATKVEKISLQDIEQTILADFAQTAFVESGLDLVTVKQRLAWKSNEFCERGQMQASFARRNIVSQE